MTTDPLDLLGNLPARWQDCFAPMTVAVPCGDSLRDITWTPEGIVCSDPEHFEAQTAFVALGGAPCACQVVADAWVSDMYQMRSDGSWSRSALGPADQQVKLGEIVGERIEEFAARSGPNAATRHLAKAGLLAWMARNGADVGDHPVVYVDVSRLGEYAPEGGSDGEEVPPVGIYGGWARGARARVAVYLTSDWYAQIREHGPLVDGRFVVGHNGEGLVLADLRLAPAPLDQPDIGEVVGVLRPQPLLDYTGQDRDAFAAVRVAAGAEDGRLALCSWVQWDYDDNNYYMTDGYQPAAVVSSPEEARIWVNYYNVTETVTVRLYEYADSTPTEWPSGFDPQEEDFPQLLAAAARAGMSLAECVVDFASWSWVADDR